MEVAYIYDAIYPWVKGGAEKRIYEISQRLARRGHSVHCYGLKWWEGEDELLRDGVYLHGLCHPMPLYVNGKRSITEAAAFAASLLAHPIKETILDCQNFPYLSCFSAQFSVQLSRMLKRKIRQKLFITWHEVWEDYWYEYMGKKGAIGQITERAASRLTNRNIAVSERTARELEGLGARGVQVVPNGIDWHGIQKIVPAERKSDIVYAGRLVAHKNIDHLIQAVNIIKTDLPDVRVIIIGDGPERERLGLLARRMNLEENIQFTGFLESYSDALALMKSSQVFASPSTREGFGLAALEANACGLPVVTVNHRMNAVMDLIREDTGWISEPDPEALARALSFALQDGRNMQESCRVLAKGYDWERICDRIEKIYVEG